MGPVGDFLDNISDDIDMRCKQPWNMNEYEIFDGWRQGKNKKGTFACLNKKDERGENWNASF